MSGVSGGGIWWCFGSVCSYLVGLGLGLDLGLGRVWVGKRTVWGRGQSETFQQGLRSYDMTQDIGPDIGHRTCPVLRAGHRRCSVGVPQAQVEPAAIMSSEWLSGAGAARGVGTRFTPAESSRASRYLSRLLSTEAFMQAARDQQQQLQRQSNATTHDQCPEDEEGDERLELDHGLKREIELGR